ncbi:MAG: MFS transporter [bacterium]|nr:MFS transporter [Gammaproteobacteria bacterium]HIL95922.1 MFS transporter [Pseudomonadales bacterium]
MYRSLSVLLVAQVFAQCAAPMVVLLGGIVGADLAPTIDLATLPVALMIVGTALTTIPAALLMGRVGRKKGFIFGACYAILAGLLAAYAISERDFPLFCVATLLIGSHNAFIQQYRFAAAESVPADKVGPTLSILMLAGVVAAYIGPETAQSMRHSVDWGDFSGSFLALSGFLTCTLLALCFYPDSKLVNETSTENQRPLLEIIGQSRFILAVGASAIGFAVMSFVMTATPVSMHTVDHHSLDDTTWVIQSHIMAMFLPSLFSGVLIAKLGAPKVISTGLALIVSCLVIAYVDQQLMHYWWALVLLGVGWNFLFLGGTTLLTQTYRTSERFKVQAFNDFLVFTPQAIAALSSGLVLSQLGWNWILALSLPWLIVLIPLIYNGTRPVAVPNA